MKKMLVAAVATVVLSGSIAGANPVGPGSVSDDGYVPAGVVAAQGIDTLARQQRLAAARSVSDVGYVPPEVLSAQGADSLRNGQRSRTVSDVGYVPPEGLAAQLVAALREERRLTSRIAALREARRAFHVPVADVGYVPKVIARRLAAAVPTEQDATLIEVE